MNDPIILSLETATRGGGVFLGQRNERLAARNGNPEVSQSASLLSDINDCLVEARLSLDDVDLFACASGPGSFTGLRIGIATLKALAASLQKPCVGIPTLQAVAHVAGPSRATVALLPAGRGEVFAQMFSMSADGSVVALDTPGHLSPQKMVERYARFRNLTWAGSGAHSQRDFLKLYAQQNEIVFAEHSREENAGSMKPGGSVWKLAPLESNLAKHVATLALQLFETDQLQSPHSLSAIYVRPSDAELNLQCR
ncbi:MAG TPA: tRNA (adenosine(37)-N6)-threonylcarbamoyltransferase complex dimerization subunit type 1 TsaB [Pyrinomonadaceae bacterium]|nr:tRNA (adenosine(37)-N6)-threonylcarbamoyltransferase complex dimerization subunit type 1 TsaB [Pyrinomonadaceae bacterium]